MLFSDTLQGIGGTTLFAVRFSKLGFGAASFFLLAFQQLVRHFTNNFPDPYHYQYISKSIWSVSFEEWVIDPLMSYGNKHDQI